jgi:uncharacterized protein
VEVWVDITNSPHVLFFAPIIRRLEDQGHTVTVTARRYAQTEQLLKRYGILAVITGQHAGKSIPAKAAGLASRTAHLIAQARGAGYEVAVGHNSNDLALAAWALGIPQLTMFDYEYAKVSHHLNLRLVDEIVVPEAIPLERLTPYGIPIECVARYPGLKEEYYLHDFEPDPAILEKLGVDGAKIVVVLRPAPEVTLYHRVGNPLVHQLVDELGGRDDVQLVILPRTDEQRAGFAADTRPAIVVPDRAVDGLSLIAAADLVVGAGGTMNREAVALGTPVSTLFAGRMGAVDERLIAEGRLSRLTSTADLRVEKKPAGIAPGTFTRDPQFFVDEIIALGRRGSWRSRRGRPLTQV